MRSIVVYKDNGEIAWIYNESDFRAYHKIMGKTDVEVDQIIKDIFEGIDYEPRR